MNTYKVRIALPSGRIATTLIDAENITSAEELAGLLYGVNNVMGRLSEVVKVRPQDAE